jgi:hypothetical protein
VTLWRQARFLPLIAALLTFAVATLAAVDQPPAIHGATGRTYVYDLALHVAPERTSTRIALLARSRSGSERALSRGPSSFGGRLAAEGGTGGGGITAALGVNEYLDDFADAESAQTWKEWANPNESFESEFRRVIGDPTTQVKFNLQGVDNPWSAVQRVASLNPNASVTDWELSEIYQNPEWWDRVTFYNGAGNPVPNPFK